MANYIPTVGVEVHVELKTKTKIFSNIDITNVMEKWLIHLLM